MCHRIPNRTTYAAKDFETLIEQAAHDPRRLIAPNEAYIETGGHLFHCECAPPSPVPPAIRCQEP